MSTNPTSPTFPVGPYTLRAATEQDRALLEQWIGDDRFHRGRVDADFFLARARGKDTWALEDERGYVVFFFATEVVCRTHIQFGPAQTVADRARNGAALGTGMEWLERTLARNGFREILFDSSNPLLVTMAKRRLGFEAAPDDLRRSIDAPKAAGAVRYAGHPVPQASRESEG